MAAETEGVFLARRVRLPDRLVIVYKTQTSGRQLKQIAVVVRDGQAATKTLPRVTSAFEQSVSS